MPEFRFTIWYCIFNAEALFLLLFPHDETKGMIRKIKANNERKTDEHQPFFLSIFNLFVLIRPKPYSKSSSAWCPQGINCIIGALRQTYAIYIQGRGRSRIKYLERNYPRDTGTIHCVYQRKLAFTFESNTVKQLCTAVSHIKRARTW